MIALTWLQNIFLKENNNKNHFIGFGGAGSNYVEFFYEKGIKGKFTSISYPKRINFPLDINFISYKLSDEKNIALSDINMEINIPNEIRNIFHSDDKFILLSGLGGYTGSLLLKEVSMLLKKLDKDFIVVCSLPFNFEGYKRQKLAEIIFNELQSYKWFKYYNLESIKKNYGKLPINIAFKKANEKVFDIISENISM